MSDIIIFHAPERVLAARYLADVIQAHGYTVETTADRDVRAADDDDATCLVMCCSLVPENTSLRSIARTAAYRGRLAAVRIEDCDAPWLSAKCEMIDLSTGKCAPRDTPFDPLMDQLERLVGRAPEADYKTLRACHDKWTRDGALALQAYPLQAPDSSDALASAPPAEAAAADRSGQEDVAKTSAEHDESPEPSTSEAQATPPAKPADHPAASSEPLAQWKSPGSFSISVGDGSADRVRMLSKGDCVKDSEFAPELVLIPPGQYGMGSKDAEGKTDEKPRHTVSIDYPLLVGKYPVTFAEWDVFLRETNRTFVPASEGREDTVARRYDDEGWGRGRRPVINVTWNDAKAYTAWLSKRLGKPYRLLSESEWEYVCRAGTDSQYFFGNRPTQLQDYAWFRDNSNNQTQPVGMKQPNGFGVHDLLGNVWEWCEDVWHETYIGAPTDGGAWLEGDGDSGRVTRGGSWFGGPKILRTVTRRGLPADGWSYYVGFRVAREAD